MNTCKTCRHPEVNQIDDLLMQGESSRNIAKRFFDLTYISIHRHSNNCLVFEATAEHAKRREGLLGKVDGVLVEIEELKSRFPDNPILLEKLIGRKFNAIEQEAKLTGAYQQDRKNETDMRKELADKWKLPEANIEEIESRFEQ